MELTRTVVSPLTGQDFAVTYDVNLTDAQVSALDREIRAAAAERNGDGVPVARWVRRFRGADFRAEPNLPPISPDHVRVELGCFDCITATYNLMALAGAADFEDYLRRLFLIRYDTVHPASAEARSGRIGPLFLDFACEAVVYNATALGFARDITGDVVAPELLREIDMELLPVTRRPEFDTALREVVPRFAGRRFRERYLPKAAVDALAPGALRRGDLLLFTRGPVNRAGKPYGHFVSHAAFAWPSGDTLNMVHTNANFFWCPERTSNEDPYYHGTLLDGDVRRQMIGFDVCGTNVGDALAVRVNGIAHYAYDQRRPMSVGDYVRNYFYGIMVFRLQ